MSDTTDSQILRAASPDSDQWDDDTWAAWFRAAERTHGDGKDRRPLFNRVGELAARVAELEAELAPYRALDLGTPEGRVSAKCPDSTHPVWLRELDDTRPCPWCRVAELDLREGARS